MVGTNGIDTCGLQLNCIMVGTNGIDTCKLSIGIETTIRGYCLARRDVLFAVSEIPGSF